MDVFNAWGAYLSKCTAVSCKYRSTAAYFGGFSYRRACKKNTGRQTSVCMLVKSLSAKNTCRGKISRRVYRPKGTYSKKVLNMEIRSAEKNDAESIADIIKRHFEEDYMGFASFDEKYIKEKMKRKIIARTKSDNSDAIKFFENNEFNQEGYFKEHYRKGIDVVQLCRFL